MNERVMVAGIDPASTTGLVCLSVLRDAPGARSAWMWVDGRVIRPSGKQGLSDAENRLALFDHARAFFNVHSIRHVAIERPADAVRAWNGQGQRGQMTGTAFALGEAYGMTAAAARAVGCRVHAYAATSRRANPEKHKRERVGWMPTVMGGKHGTLRHTQPREATLAQLHALACELRHRPYGGVFKFSSADSELDENIRMALGVLAFHLNRQPSL